MRARKRASRRQRLCIAAYRTAKGGVGLLGVEMLVVRNQSSQNLKFGGINFTLARFKVESLHLSSRKAIKRELYQLTWNTSPSC
jgi:hypothetical protein